MNLKEWEVTINQIVDEINQEPPKSRKNKVLMAWRVKLESRTNFLAPVPNRRDRARGTEKDQPVTDHNPFCHYRHWENKMPSQPALRAAKAVAESGKPPPFTAQRPRSNKR